MKELEPFILSDPLLRKALPNGTRNIQVSYRRRGKNIKEFLATAKINTPSKIEEIGQQLCCGKDCVYCPLLEETNGASFRSSKTGRIYKLRQTVNCESTWVVYLVTCKKCSQQGVGSTKTLKSRIANYKTVITRRKSGKCGIDHHFLQKDHSWNDFSIQVIVKMTKLPQRKSQEEAAYSRLRQLRKCNWPRSTLMA